MPEKRNLHRPFHLELENEFYFLTGRLYSDSKVFYKNSNKDIFLNLLFDKIKIFDYQIFTFAVLLNHYHLLLKINKKPISDFINQLQGSSSFIINRIESRQGRKNFYQYWDWCIRNEADFYKHFNYINQNPIKHGLVKNLEELVNYKYCGYKYLVEKNGEEFVFDCFYYYPIGELNIKDY